MNVSKFLSIFFLWSSFGWAAPAQQPIDFDWNVFGTDQRQPVTSKEFPWKAIGRLNNGCTGTLVGRDLVLTAAHCVLDGNTGKLSSWVTSFSPNYMNGSAADSSGFERIWWGTGAPDSNRGNDWALIRLSKALGDTYGWLGVSPDLSTTVTLVGYSSDFQYGNTAGAHVNCSIRQNTGTLLYHDCHATRGSSGGPMFVTRTAGTYIVALNVAEYRNGGETSLYPSSYSSTYANIAIPASVFLAKLKELK